MKILILGGTIFLGRHLVELALARGHRVTLFNRGQHNPELFPEVERLRGDRREDLEPLRGRSWDAVIDTCGYIPREVRASASQLAGAAGHYTFISSISVYSDLTPGLTEESPLATLEDETVEEVTGETYGGLKVLCERAAEEAMPGRTLIVRPGLIVGPHDKSDRFTYWPHRIAQGGEVLAPAPPDQPCQLIDCRDLAAFTLDLIERNVTGAYNATGPHYPLTLGHMLDTCVTVTGSDARLVWADEEFLLAQGVQPWMDLPLWINEKSGMRGIAQVDLSKPLAAGLRFRSLEETIRDTLAWSQTRPADHMWAAGLTRDKEAEVLGKWVNGVNG